jgi:hypothetical protein
MFVSDVELGSIITFRSKRADDTVLWRGTLIGTGIYQAIRSLMNPQSYNEAVRQVDDEVPSDVTLLNYFMIIIDNGSDVPNTQVFAEEWIEEGSLTVINLSNKIKILVEDPFSNSQQIVSVLANAGYTSKIIP